MARTRLYDLVPTYRAMATLHAPMDRLAPALGDEPGTLTPVDEHTCRWHSQADTIDWLAFRLTVLGCEFTVHEPAELIDNLRALAGRITRATET